MLSVATLNDPGSAYHRDLSAALDDVGKPDWEVQTGWGSPRRGIVDLLTSAVEDYRQGH